MVKNSLFLTSFCVAIATNIDVIWMPLCWLLKDLLDRSKDFQPHYLANCNWTERWKFLFSMYFCSIGKKNIFTTSLKKSLDRVQSYIKFT